MTNKDLSFEVCPRCEGPIEIHGTTKLAAGSRVTKDRDIKICAPCGQDEAVREHHTGNLIPSSRWPVTNPHEWQRKVQDEVNRISLKNDEEGF